MSEQLIYDWNAHAEPEIPRGRRVTLNDETLRDGLQNPSVRDPSTDEKIEILHLMESLGIDLVNIGLPGAGPRAFADTEALAREILGSRMKIRANMGGRTHPLDVQAMIDICERAGQPIEAAMFLGSSPIRRLVEDWTVDHLKRTTEESVRLATNAGLPVMYVTEDTIRTDPSTVIALYSTAIRAGARAIVLCDTVGHATPRGAYNLVKFAIEEIVKPSGEKIRVDWHGHNDRGLAVANSLAAIAAGADQVHACALALGERVGNTPMEVMLVNLRLLGLIDRDLSRLKEYSETVARATGTVIPPNYPIVGRDAFRTATGVHAAAIAKAHKRDDPHLADAIYSGVPAHLFGLEQVIEVGPMSGRSNVVYWLAKRGVLASDEAVDRILAAAKQSSRILTEDEILALAQSPTRH
ncbi:MAG TPA: LeuA family protein [Candidatus Acidoferrales bacterium]|jgi:2-isopropylmalate synthase|nr:LeuA family protein [Candidatus Acidoferrales bacterium]